MAQTKTIQLLRSSSLYESLTAAKEALQATNFVTARSDGELVLARYTHTTGEGQEATTTIKSVIGVYHKAPNLPGGSAAGVTFIEDFTSAAGSAAALQAEIDRIETAVGLGETGTKSDFTGAAVTDGVIAASDDLIAAIQKVANAIAGMDKAADAVNGQVVTTVAQTNGSVTETKANVKDLQLGGYSKDTSATGAIGSTDTVNTALNKLENNIAANDTARTVASSDQSITVTNSASGTNVVVNVDGTTIVKDGTSGALKSGLKVIKVIPTGTAGADEVVDATLATNVKEAYRLVYNGSTTAIGQQVNVYKESALDRVYMGHVDDTVNSSTGVVTSGTGDDAMCFIYHQADGTYTLVSVNVESFLQETEFGDGLQVANHVVTVKTGDGLEYGSESGTNKSVKVKVDTAANGNEFLSVSANGIKVSGVSTAITNAINALDVTTDAAVAGQYVAAIEQTDGVVAVKSRANVSDAVLTGYSKGSSAPASTAVASTDDVKGAIAKLEWQIDAVNSGSTSAIEALDAEVTSSDGTNVQVKVTEVDGKITAVNITNDNTINTTYLQTEIQKLGADLDASGNATHGGTFVVSGVTEVDGVITSVDSVEVEAAGAAAAAKTEIDAYTVNSKAISTNPVLNGSDIALTGYSKGSDGTAVSASDSVNVAIGKLENQVDAAKAAATAAHTSVEHATGNTHVTVSASQPDSTTGKVTYTVNETNIADADDLTAEIAARKAVDGQSGDTYTANSGANYIGSAKSLNNADVQLDTALKAVDDAMITQINGSNAIDVTTKASKQQTVSLKLDTTTPTGNITSDMLQITSNGLMMKDVWDCGVF